MGNILGILRTYDNITSKQIKIYRFLRVYQIVRLGIIIPLLITLFVAFLKTYNGKARLL